jgi:2-amino-4-hydroxy-6-hydroxymethyldihydropteridine diphosphokinase
MSRALIIKRPPDSADEMEYADWAPSYERIRTEFGFPMAAEERSAGLLATLLPATARTDGLGRAIERLRGRDVVVVGLAPRAGPPPVWRLRSDRTAPAIVAADGAAETCLGAGLVPAIVVTDLDGPVAAEVAANRRGSLVAVHAHGDNAPALAEWVPQFPGELSGSWAGPPTSVLFNVGGFTDGDRAVCLAEHARARRILLWGFDPSIAEEATEAERARKLAKLRWADRIIAGLARDGRVPILHWGRDGALAPYGGGISDASTR